MCCTDRSLTLLLNVLSLGPAHPPAGGSWHGRARRVAAIASAADFLVAPRAAACTMHAPAAADSPLCGPLPRRRSANQHADAPALAKDELPSSAARSTRRNLTGGEDGGDAPFTSGEATTGGWPSTESPMGAAASGWPAIPQPQGSEDSLSEHGGGRRLRRTNSSLAEATAAAETLTQLVRAAHAAAAQQEGGGHLEEALPADQGDGGSTFVAEVLDEAQRALAARADVPPAQPDMPDVGRVGNATAAAGEAGHEPPAKARRVLPTTAMHDVRAVDVHAGSGGMGGWVQPESPCIPPGTHVENAGTGAGGRLEGDGAAGAEGQADAAGAQPGVLHLGNCWARTLKLLVPVVSKLIPKIGTFPLQWA